jgi:hypothetical protein
MSSIATTNETSNVTSLPTAPQPQTRELQIHHGQFRDA